MVVWSLVVKYVWKPANPITDHTLRKQTIAMIKLNGASLIASNVISFLSLATAIKIHQNYHQIRFRASNSAHTQYSHKTICVVEHVKINTVKNARETMNM